MARTRLSNPRDRTINPITGTTEMVTSQILVNSWTSRETTGWIPILEF